MRLHQFETDVGMVWVDLDQAHTIKRHEKFPKQRSVVAMPNGCVVVYQPVEDVVALISPPAAPDTYEEELRERKGTVAKMLRDGEIRIRVDELDRALAAWADCSPYESFLRWAFARRREIDAGKL